MSRIKATIAFRGESTDYLCQVYIRHIQSEIKIQHPPSHRGIMLSY